MGQRARLVGVDFEVVALCVTEIHDGGGGAVLCRREPARVAVREESVAGADERQSVFTDASTGVNVLRHDGACFVTQVDAQLRDGGAAMFLHNALHASERPREVDGSRSRCIEIERGVVQAAREFRAVVRIDPARGEVKSDGGGVADGGRAAHLQLLDRIPNLTLRF